jgi:hypothetical protein
MFQYAAGRALATRLDVPLLLDVSWFSGQDERRFALSSFNIEAEQSLQCPVLSPRILAITSRISRRFLPSIRGVPVWREPHFHYATEFEDLTVPHFLEGYWQSERYFRDISALLLQDFTLRRGLPPPCTKLLEKIRGCDAICVHVRRGDYLSNPVAAEVHGTCSVDYYAGGVDEISRGLQQPHCFVFSDDPAWVRSTLAFNCPMTIVDLNGPDDAHLDLALMASCCHFLIANSSLSWWGAWLGTHTQKKVIAPARWFLVSNKDTRDLLPKSWQQR